MSESPSCLQLKTLLLVTEVLWGLVSHPSSPVAFLSLLALTLGHHHSSWTLAPTLLSSLPDWFSLVSTCPVFRTLPAPISIQESLPHPIVSGQDPTLTPHILFSSPRWNHGSRLSNSCPPGTPEFALGWTLLLQMRLFEMTRLVEGDPKFNDYCPYQKTPG